jgi:hypothetical protein
LVTLWQVLWLLRQALLAASEGQDELPAASASAVPGTIGVDATAQSSTTGTGVRDVESLAELLSICAATLSNQPRSAMRTATGSKPVFSTSRYLNWTV